MPQVPTTSPVLFGRYGLFCVESAAPAAASDSASGFGQLVGLLKDVREKIESRSDFHMIFIQAGAPDAQRFAQRHLCLPELSLFLKRNGKRVGRERDFRVVIARDSPADRQFLPPNVLGFHRFALAAQNKAELPEEDGCRAGVAIGLLSRNFQSLADGRLGFLVDAALRRFRDEHAQLGRRRAG